jgi:hypothetical protein
MDIELTPQDMWLSTLVFVILDLIALVPLLLLFRSDEFVRCRIPIGLASALFWGVLATVAIIGFWGLYYQYIFPTWMRWLAPLDAVLYALIGLAIWWLSIRLPGSSILWFVLLGGLEGIAEHLMGIYAFRILEKVPWLQGITPFQAVVFSFFEYVFYWAIVAWLAFIFIKIGSLIPGR